MKKKKQIKELDRKEKIRLLQLKREKKIRLAREDFWEFCKATAPDFYKESRTYLKDFCNTLQGLFDGDIINPETGKKFRGAVVSFPPRHGKSYTVQMFGSFLMGRDIAKSVIALSYNVKMATEFSRNTLTIIKEEKQLKKITFNDVFPEVHIQRGDGAVNSWSLEGGYQNFLSTSFDGTLTGRGTKGLLVIDDAVKNADTALNKKELQNQWEAYTNTVMSRVEKGAFTLIVMTRWSGHDLAGKVLSSNDGKNFYVVNYKACLDESKGLMLCDEILDFEDYMRLKADMSEIIFQPNFQQVLIDSFSLMYPDMLKRKYEDIPRKADGSPAFTSIVAYVDPAQGGGDYFATVIAGVYDGYFYVLDIIYNKKSISDNEELLVDKLMKNNVKKVIIETNFGGKVFVTNIRKRLWEKYGTRQVVIEELVQRNNKETRMIMNAPAVNSTIFFPLNVAHADEEMSEAWEHIITFPQNPKNVTHDDIEDALTGLVEKFGSNSKKKMTVIKKPIGI